MTNLTAMLDREHTHSFLLPLRRGGRPEEGYPLSGRELDSRYFDLNQEMKMHRGELVLVVVRRWEQTGFDMPEEITPYSLDEVYYLGIIGDENAHVGFDDFYGIVDTRRYVEFSPWRPQGIEKVEGQIRAMYARRENLDRQARAEGDPPGFGYGGNGEKLLEIAVGDRAVSEWFQEEAQYGRMSRSIRELINDPAVDSDYVARVKEKYFSAEVIALYRKMQVALGRVIH